MAKTKPLTDKQRALLRVFAGEPDSGEPAIYCGDLRSFADLKLGIGAVVVDLINDLYWGERTEIDSNLKVVKMTDAQFYRLPDGS